ncbi:hypothetical protein ACIBKX_07535 [Streptomyces sp. NPDC050658]|uniref:hypothetical protein n=1 Tax=unclassified Streptomyces TaxID=2593676 RepID=UPI0034287130
MPASETKETSGPEPVDETPESAAGTAAEKLRGGDRRAYIAGGAVLAACLGLVVLGVLDTEDEPAKRRVPTASVTYELSGEGNVEVSYLARSEEGRATIAKNVRLPWKKTVQVPLGKAPSVNIVLDKKGGQVRCALAVRGKHVQSATASGGYGRATCSGELPAPVPTDEPTVD